MLLFLIVSLVKPIPVDVKISSEPLRLKEAIGSFILEDFEIWPPGTFTLDPASGTGAWQQSPLTSAYYISPQEGASGQYGAEFYVWGYYIGVTGDMLSYPVDLVGATSPEFSFYFWNHTDLTVYGNDDSTIVSISTDGGGSWSTLGIYKGDVDNWTKHTHDLSSHIGDTVIIRFRGISDYGGSDMGIDMVLIGQRPQLDAGVARILNPDDYTTPTTPFIPSCEITSLGIDTVYDFYAYLQVDSMGTLIHRDSVLIDTLFSEKNDTIQFPQMTLSSDFYYAFIYFTLLPGDGYSLNDTVSAITRCYTSDRMVIGELATNTSCGPCQPANDTLDQIFPDYPDNLALVRYHAWWPSSADPFYQYNIPENEARVNYYGADYVPHFYIDGDVDVGSGRNTWRDFIEHEILKPSPLEVIVSGVYMSYIDAGTLYVSVNATGEPVESNLFLRYCLVENGIRYNAPNGQTIFHQVFRDMFPNTSGVVIGDLHYGEVFVDTQAFTVDAATINEDSAEIVVFVQSDDNKHILQGGRMTLLAGVDEEPLDKESLRILNIPPIIVRESNGEIKFILESSAYVNVSIYDITGRMRMNLIEGKLVAGIHTLSIESEKLTSGLYFISFSYNNERQMRKVVILQ